MTFGEFFKGKRKLLNLSLREFAQTNGYDAAYISRIENDLMDAPSDKEKLAALAKSVKVFPETTEWVEFFDLAYASNTKLPPDIENGIDVFSILPAFYRTARKPQIEKSDVDELLRLFNTP